MTLRLAILVEVSRDVNSNKIINVVYATAAGNGNECQIYLNLLRGPPNRPPPPT